MAKSAEFRMNNLMSLIGQSDKVHDMSHVNLQIKTEGFLFWKKETILLSGRVNREMEKKEILDIIAREYPDTELKESLRIDAR